jgi:5'-nucleotidase
MRWHREHEDEVFRPGVAFGFIRRLLALNDLAAAGDPLVEVVLLSRNDAESGLRVKRSIAHYGLAITRSVFTRGSDTARWLEPLRSHLFLSTSAADVRAAIAGGFAAGLVKGRPIGESDDLDSHLRVAFDFDGVLAADDAERVHANASLAEYHRSEAANARVPLPPGPLQPLIAQLARISRLEDERRRTDPTYGPRVRIALVTARSAPAHERAIRTLRSWEVEVHEALFLGGLQKADFLRTMRPHLFFDDLEANIAAATDLVPCVHVPYGVNNPA